MDLAWPARLCRPASVRPAQSAVSEAGDLDRLDPHAPPPDPGRHRACGPRRQVVPCPAAHRRDKAHRVGRRAAAGRADPGPCPHQFLPPLLRSGQRAAPTVLPASAGARLHEGGAAMNTFTSNFAPHIEAMLEWRTSPAPAPSKWTATSSRSANHAHSSSPPSNSDPPYNANATTPQPKDKSGGRKYSTDSSTASTTKPPEPTSPASPRQRNEILQEPRLKLLTPITHITVGDFVDTLSLIHI